MTINDVEEMWSRASKVTKSSDGKKFSVSFTRVFEITHSADELLENIEAAPGIALRDRYGSYPNVYCTQLGPVERAGTIFSRVPIQYEGEIGGKDTDDPVFSPPDFDYGSISSEEDTDEDARGVPLTTTCAEPVHGMKTELHDMYLNVTRNFLGFSGTSALQYLHSVNSDSLNVFGDIWLPGQAAMRSFKIKPVFDEESLTVSYYKVSARIEFRTPYNTTAARAWWHRYRNEGFYARFDSRVTFSGGAGSGAAGYPIVNASGVITKIVITAPGKGYTSAPSVSVASDDGGASFAGTAVLGTDAGQTDEVASVTVTNGGTGYKSGIMRITDKMEEPVTKPQLIAGDGSLLEDASTPFYVERPQKLFYLRYTDLGLI